MFKLIKSKIKYKFVVTFIAISLIPLVIISFINIYNSREKLKEESFNKLTLVKELKKEQIEKYFDNINKQILTLSEDKMIVSAMREFNSSFHNYLSENKINDNDLSNFANNVKKYYQQEFLFRLNKNLDSPDNIDKYWSNDPYTIAFQNLYIYQNSYPTGEKLKLDAASDGSTYSKTHSVYHPIIRNFLERFGFYDIFLVDIKTGHIVYTVFKEVDFSTSLLTGPYKNTKIAEVFNQASEANTHGEVFLSDFDMYAPSYNAPAAFISTPIYDGKEKIGVLIFQMPIDEINNIMLSGKNWENIGLGKSGETYLVGEDLKMRSNSRFLIEDKEGYLAALKKAGVAPDVLKRIESLNTSILFQPCETETAKRALQGEKGTAIITDYRDVNVLSAYIPLNLKGLKWGLLAEIDKDEAFKAANNLTYYNLLIVILTSVLVFMMSIKVAKIISAPIIEISNAAQKIERGEEDVVLKVTSSDEIGTLETAFNAMVEKLNLQISYLDKVPTPITIVDKDFDIVYANKKGAELLGKTTKDLMGKKCYDNFKTGICNTDRCVVAKAIKEKKVTSDESSMNINNSDIPILLSGAEIKNKAGLTLGGLEYITEITEIKERENYLTRSSEKLMQAMDKFSEGDLNVQVQPEKLDDQMGKLYKFFNNSVLKIKNMIMDVNFAVSDTLNLVQDFSNAVNHLAHGATKQTEQTTEIAGAIEEMSKTIIETSKNTANVSLEAKKSGEHAKEGGEVVNRTIEGINKISQVIHSAVNVVDSLGNSTKKIGEITNVINDIADQTNLLALNAAIEAARAGEQGRGFAVVADEVRKLAEKTSKATKEISIMINSIQSEANLAISSIKEGSVEIEKGVVLAREAGNSLTKIINSSSNLVDLINQVAAASEQQSAASEQISKSVENISAISQEFAGISQEINNYTNNLNNLMDNLSRLLENFKVSESKYQHYLN